MTNSQITNNQNKFDLEPRTINSAKNIIKLCKTLPFDNINSVLTNQIIRSSASVGANYRQANDALSKKDFIHKITIAKKEIKETKHWLRLLARAEVNQKEKIIPIWKEKQELLLIFSKIINSCKNKNWKLENYIIVWKLLNCKLKIYKYV